MTETRFDQILRQLPQTQCGECGYAGCEPYARAMDTGNAACNLCPPGGVRVWNRLAEITKRPTKEPPAPHLPHRVRIDPQICIGCYKCVRVCPVDAIAGAPKRLHQVNLAACTGCDLCIPVCPVDCIHPVAMDDPDHHYYDPATIYQQRQMSWQAHQQRLHSRPVAKSTNHSTAASQPITDGQHTIIKNRLRQALQRATRLGDDRAEKQLRQQLDQLQGRAVDPA